MPRETVLNLSLYPILMQPDDVVASYVNYYLCNGVVIAA